MFGAGHGKKTNSPKSIDKGHRDRLPQKKMTWKGTFTIKINRLEL
jgi:hypothetical protein